MEALPAMLGATAVSGSIIIYVILFVLAVIIAGHIWRVAKATLEFVADILVPLLKIILIVIIFIILLKVVAKFNLVGADVSNLFHQTGFDLSKTFGDLTAPLF
eukprot:PLAT15830.1.p3 GENE.PLAT15830.1~~PLAT15830.1.p3  ORF type:complete len:118 (-),score=48.67 PLAT15830.1:276-584(-)